VTFTVTVPIGTPPNTPVYLLLLPFTDWEWQEHIRMTDQGGGVWTATARLEEGALAHYAYDTWDETDWGQFAAKREAALFGVPVTRRLVYVEPEITQVNDVVAAWRGAPAEGPAGSITGKVTNEDGEAVVDSEVTVAGLHIATDWDGTFRAEVAAGRQRVTVYRSDGAHMATATEVDVPAGGEVAVELRVRRAREVPFTFRVQLPPGTPEAIEVRMVGSVRQTGSSTGGINTPPLMAASTRLPVLNRIGPDTAEIRLVLREGSYVQYFYTLTSSSHGREWQAEPRRPRFRSMVAGGQSEVRRDAVAAWGNRDFKDITFRVTVPLNTPAGVPIAFEMGPTHWLTQTGPRTWEFTINSVPNAGFRYRYLIGGDGAGADGTAGLEEGGYRRAKLEDRDLVVNDIVERWAGLPTATEAAPGARVDVVLNVSVPRETPEGAEVVWAPEDGSARLPMKAAEGNRWLYRAELQLPAGQEVAYHIERLGDTPVRGPTRLIRASYQGETFNDWVVAWSASGASPGPVGSGGPPAAGGPGGAGVPVTSVAGDRLGYLAGYYPPDFWSRDFLALSDTTFARVAAHNGNLVALSSVWSYGRIKPHPMIESRAVQAPSVLTPRGDLVEQIEIAHRRGLQVLLAPQFNMEMSPGGLAALANNSSAWWDEWLAEAERMWLWNAQVAEETGAEYLLLPGFVFHVFTGPWAFESADAFRAFDAKLAALVLRVREVYGGKILISGGVLESRAPGLADLVGVTTYDTGHPELAATSTVEEWRTAYDALFKEKVDPIRETWGRPVMLYQLHLPSPAGDRDPDAQLAEARRLEGLMQAIDDRPWIAGSLSWSYSMIDAPLADTDGVRGRIAEAVLAKYYGRFTGRD
jgi:hypothetical protein